MPASLRNTVWSTVSLLLLAGAVPTLADDAQGELEQIAETLKAAVMSGAMSEKDAIGIYEAMAARLERQGKGGAGDDRGDKEKKAGNFDAMLLTPPAPERIAALFQPEFLTRDLATLRDVLGFDVPQMTIAEVLLRDYREGLELASAPLREALRRYRRSTADQWIAAAFERAELGDVETATAKLRARLDAMNLRDDQRAAETDRAAATGEKRAARAEWQRRMLEVTESLGERLTALRERVNEELAAIQRDDAVMTADDLVQLARTLRSERTRLREETTQSLALITNDEQRGDADVVFAGAMARLRVVRLLPAGRLGGESMDLWAVLRDLRRSTTPAAAGTMPLEEAATMLRRGATTVATALDARTDATIEREIEGLVFQARRDALAGAGAPAAAFERPDAMRPALRAYADALRLELTASVAVRDALLELLETTATALAETYPGTGIADRFREAALRNGFRREMQPRWTERAFAAVLDLGDLEPALSDALETIGTETDVELAALRAEAVSRRVHRDPVWAREQIDARYAVEPRKLAYAPDLWLGMNFEAFQGIDDRTERTLRSVLTPEQFAQLPVRRRIDTKGKNAKDKGKAVGKGSGKKAAGKPPAGKASGK